MAEVNKTLSKVDEMDLFEVIKIPKSVMKKFGQWPSDHLTWFSKIRGIATFLIVVTFCGSLLMEAVYIVEDFVGFLNVLTFFSLTLSYVLKVFDLKTHESNFVELYNFLNDQTLSNIPRQLQHHVRRPVRLARMIMYGYYLSCGLTLSFICLFPLVSEKYLPISFTVFDVGNSYLFVYVFQCVGLACACSNNSSLDVMAIALMCLVKGQVCVLNENIRFFRENAQKTGLTDVAWLAECVNHHNKIITLVELIERVFSSGVLVQYLTSVMIICNIGFQLVIVEVFSPTFLLMLSFFVAVMFQIGIYCWFGNEIILNSSAIRDACYESGWMNADTDAQKMLIIIMERSKRPLYLTAGKFSILSLASFTSVINSAYSFFALMQRMYGKPEDK